MCKLLVVATREVCIVLQRYSREMNDDVAVVGFDNNEIIPSNTDASGLVKLVLAKNVNDIEEAKKEFEKAKKEDKPVFLSVGYSTCHWCHVMERESF